MNKEIQKRKDELLVELIINVPQIEWEFQRVDEEIKHFNDGRTLNGYDIFYNGIHKESKDECFIKFDNGRLNVLELGYYHFPNDWLGYQWKNINYNYINDWDGVNEFFNKYCIGFDGREEKIKSGEMVTPNMMRMKSVGSYNMSKDEYSQGLLHLLLPHPTKNFNGKTDIDCINQSFSNFEKEYKELRKEFNLDDDCGYFGTQSEMIESFLDTKLSSEIEHYLGEVMNEVEKDLKEEELETIEN
ncbi:hypothetical protein N8911_02040 [bacterium]|nr:hypothetical protein [bacterium]